MVPVVPLEVFAALIGGGDLKQTSVIRLRANVTLHIKDVTSTVPAESSALGYWKHRTTSVFRVDFYTVDRGRIIPRNTCTHLADYKTTSNIPSGPTNKR